MYRLPDLQRKTAECRFIAAPIVQVSSSEVVHYDEGSRLQETVLKILKDYRATLKVMGMPLTAFMQLKFETVLQTKPEAATTLDYIALL